MFPLFVPGIIAAYALIRFLGNHGWLDRFLHLLFGYEDFVSPYLRPAGIVVGLAWEGISVTVLILTAGLSQNTGPFTGDGAGCRSQPPADILAHRNPAHAAVSPDRPHPELLGRIWGLYYPLSFGAGIPGNDGGLHAAHFL